ncbi:MAG: YgiQ family radical SAM protein, partial [Firmicutes bacterium]|nr:YgiQ family radical SAM protein [Bacillota bacterium]
WIRGTAVKVKGEHLYPQDDDIVLPSFEELSASKDAYCKRFALQYRSNDSITGKRVIEEYPGNLFVLQNPPQPPLEREELDDLYDIPFERDYHPSYEKDGGVPAIKEVKFSIAANRGCFGGCAFCAITYHQGREVRSRSRESVVREAETITKLPDFKGYIHDVGGPTANFRNPSCDKQIKHGMCGTKDCLYPKPCSQLKADHREYMDVLRAVRGVRGVKKVFIRSGIRYDYLMADKDRSFLEELCRYHVSGILKVAPEHISKDVLSNMRKPEVAVFDRFCESYRKTNEKLGKKQYMVPYFISSHPGSSLEDAIELALYLKETGFVPDQVQDFYPTPGTLSTCMYYTEKDPFTMKPVYVAKSLEEKKMQRALLHFNKKENRKTVIKALEKAGRKDLIKVLAAGDRR